MTRTRAEGFTLMEVAVAASMIAMVMVGMSTILVNYASSRTKVNGLQVARNICLSEIDDILLHNQIENSLVSDTMGRARPVLLTSLGLTVSNYFYCNFPANADHNYTGMQWEPDKPDTVISRFEANALYGGGGVKLYESGMVSIVDETDPRVEYVVRRQLFGLSGNVTNVEFTINGEVTAAWPHGKYLDTAAWATTPDPTYLIADTCRNETGTPWPVSGTSNIKFNDATYNGFDQKVYVVRVYAKKAFLTHLDGSPQGTPRFYDDKKGIAKNELTHSYTVINGKIRL